MLNSSHPYRVPFLNAQIDNVHLSEVHDIVAEHIRTREAGYMVSLNTDIVISLEHDPGFMAAHRDASLVLMDSQPLFDLAVRQGIPMKKKISGSDLVDPVCSWAAEEGWSIFIMGGMPGVPEKAAENLMAQHPGLRVVGTLSPERGFEHDVAMTNAVIRAVCLASPDILFLCVGSPKSEKFLHARLAELGVPFSFVVGAAVDFAAGNVKRAPKWMSDHGLEWFYRFIQEPKRLFKRYFVDSWQLLGIIRKYGKGAAQ